MDENGTNFCVTFSELKMASPAGGSSMRRISSNTKMRLLANATNPLATVTGAETHNMSHDSMRRVASSSSLSSLRKFLEFYKLVFCQFLICSHALL